MGFLPNHLEGLDKNWVSPEGELERSGGKWRFAGEAGVEEGRNASCGLSVLNDDGVPRRGGIGWGKWKEKASGWVDLITHVDANNTQRACHHKDVPSVHKVYYKYIRYLVTANPRHRRHCLSRVATSYYGNVRYPKQAKDCLDK